MDSNRFSVRLLLLLFVCLHQAFAALDARTAFLDGVPYELLGPEPIAESSSISTFLLAAVFRFRYNVVKKT